MTAVLLIGTLDTKAEEIAHLRERLDSAGVRAVIIDVSGRAHDAGGADVTAAQVAEAAGVSLGAVRSGGRAAAIAAVARGARLIALRMYEEGQISGVLGIGGSGGAVIAAGAMRALPTGVPKLLVSPVAAGDTRPFVGGSDVTLMHTVTDLAGLNRITSPILDNAAAAIAAMARAAEWRSREDCPRGRVAAATMFGITTPGVTAGRDELVRAGYEVQVFSANGAGGRALERRIGDGQVDAVLDLTTTELADEIVGGILSAGPRRLEAAAIAGVAQVVSTGATDAVNFGPVDTVPERFAGRRLHVHNDAVTLMRTSPEESAEIGLVLARRLNAGTGRRCVMIPLRGFSALSYTGGPFDDNAADAALIDTLRAELGPGVERVELDLHINDPGFGRAAATRLIEFGQDEAARIGTVTR